MLNICITGYSVNRSVDHTGLMVQFAMEYSSIFADQV